MASATPRFLRFVVATLVILAFFNLRNLSRTSSKASARRDIANGEYHKRADIPSASAADYQKAATKGQLLICWMKDPSLAGAQAVSKWNDWADIAKWGWTDRTTTNYLGETAPGIRDLVPSSNDLTNADKKFAVKHDRSSTGYPVRHATNADYSNNIYPESGVIVADWNWSPNAAIADEMTSKGSSWNPSTDKKPELSQLSDFWWLGWAHFTTASERPNLRHIVQHNVVNDPTQQILASVLRKHYATEEYPSQGKAPAWPGKVITPDMEGFDALLGINSVWGIPWMLIQHHDELGQLEVKKITCYTEVITPTYYQPNLIVELGPVINEEP